MADPIPHQPLPDIRVLSITMEPPMWVPKIEYGDDFDDLGAAMLLRLAAKMLEEQLLEAFMCPEDDDPDDD